MTAFNRNKNELPRVLLVDDDITARLLAQEFLNREGFSVVEAEDGLQALHVFQETKPHIVLMDVDMPNMDGFEACRQLRCLPAGKTVPILMVTGREDIDSIEKAYDAGATDFSPKPTNWVILMHRLRYMLRSSTMLQDLHKSEDRLDKAQRLARLGNWEWNIDLNETFWSEQLYHILGIRHRRSAPSFEAFLQSVPSCDRERVRLWYQETLKSEKPASINHKVVNPEGKELIVQHQAEVQLDELGNARLMSGTVLDITQLKQAQEKILQLANFDSLTGLANRLIFKERAKQALELSNRYNRQGAILFLDLDNFKRINDTLGHTAGDLLLQEVAERLRGSIRNCDWIGRLDARQVARFGGDEFTLLLTEIQHVNDAETVAQRILDALTAPITLSGHDVVITPSIGISHFPHDGTDIDTLLKYADTAMYFAKNEGKNQYALFNKTMNENGQRRLKLENCLRYALDKGELYLNYQPQVELKNNSIVGVEALLRWQNDELGLVSPEEFIPVAEESGLILAIGEWVLREACTQAKKWKDQGLPKIRMAVNLSVRQFIGHDLEDLVSQVLQETGLPADWLELEITETMLIDDVEGTVTTLNKLKEMGVQLAIDDFGVGYSSLNYLKRFPIDRLKIDRSFVTHVALNPNDASLTLAMVAMAHSLKLDVIAEGVETVEQRTFLQERHCDEMQGYFFSRPVSEQQMEELLLTQKMNSPSPQSQEPDDTQLERRQSRERRVRKDVSYQYEITLDPKPERRGPKDRRAK